MARAERTRLFLFHKPRGLVTTAHDPEGRPTIFDALPPDLPRWSRRPARHQHRRPAAADQRRRPRAGARAAGDRLAAPLPRARAWRRRPGRSSTRCSDGITIDGIDYAASRRKLDREQGSNAWITMGLREGKNREIKRVLEHLGLAVNRLIRVSFGPFQLGDLAEGEVAEVRTRVLRDQLGVKLAKEAGVDFDAPIAEPRPDPDRERARARSGRERAASAGQRPRVPRARGEEARERRARRRAAPPAPSRPPSAGASTSRPCGRRSPPTRAGPRKRIAGRDPDRKGRTVAVERISLTAEEAGKRAAAVTRAPR